jgi:hypothetical protein
MKTILSLFAIALPLTALQAQEAQLVRFVACPVYRDTDAGRKSGCWLAQDPETGQRWDVSLSPYKPDWNHAVLVEGRVSGAGSEACGDPVLDAVRTSRLLDIPCPRHMIPAEGYPGRVYRLEGRYVNPIGVPPRELPEEPFTERTFPLYFEFNQDFLVYQYDDYLIDRTFHWLAAANPRKVVVTGYAATEPDLVSGHSLAEDPEVAERRADAVAESLRRLLPGLEIETRTGLAAQPIADADADGIPGQSQRRAEILALF